MNKYENHIKGAFVGGWCGDASGTLLKFHKNEITLEMVNHTIHMNGDGIFNVGKGQITNDSELELAMIHGMLKNNNKEIFPYEAICEEYIELIKSYPFDDKSLLHSAPLKGAKSDDNSLLHSAPLKGAKSDVGRTCANAFGTSTNLESMLKNASQLNSESESNGALMRAVPLAIWGLNLSEEDLMKIACLDARLSHPNPICQIVNSIYVIVLRHLILHPNDCEGALHLILKYSDQKPLRIWYKDALYYENINPRINIKHIKHAFQLMVYFLNGINIISNKDGSIRREKFDYDYEEVIRRILLLGGDTDINAKIIGALIGAMKGFDSIPDYMKNPVLYFDCGRMRPEKYLIKNIFEKIDKLYY